MTGRHPHLLILVGLPGSGKSTYAERLQARCPALRIVCPDEIRARRHPGYAAGQVDVRRIDDRSVFHQAYREAAVILQAGRDVLFDATSLTVRRRRTLILLAERHGALPVARFFPVPLAVALERNRRRPRVVPPGAIVHMAKILEPPVRAEGFQRVAVHRQHARQDKSA